MQRFTLYGSPHSLPTYKVALMLRLSSEPFSFRYVSFQKGMHRTPEFLALSRWGQVPVLVDGEHVYLQSAAIVEHLAETLAGFKGPIRHRARPWEWLCWDVDVLFPPVFGCYAVRARRTKTPADRRRAAIAAYHRQRGETALSVLDSHLAHRSFLCATEPTIADRSTATSPSPNSVFVESLAQRGGLVEESYGTGGLQGAVRIADHGKRRVVDTSAGGTTAYAGSRARPPLAAGNFRRGDHRLRPAFDTEFLQDRGDVRLDRRFRHAEFVGDLLVEQAFRQHHQHAHLLRGQASPAGRAAASCPDRRRM